MAIGDNYNDVEMLNYAGQPVLMANAPAELLERAKKSGWAITRTNDEDGVAHSIMGALQRNGLWEEEHADEDKELLVSGGVVKFP